MFSTTRFSRFAALTTLIAAPVLLAPSAQAVEEFWNTGGTAAVLTSANWGTTAAGPFTGAYVTTSNIDFTANSAVLFVTTTERDITITNASTVSGTSTAGSVTLNQGAAVRTWNIGAGSQLKFDPAVTWNYSTTAGNGLIKNGDGWVTGLNNSNASSLTAGFTLNAGVVTIAGVNGMGNSGPLTLNGGTIASTSSATRNFEGRYSGITIGGNVTFGDSVNFLASTGSMTFGGANTISLGAVARTLATGNSINVNLSGPITNTAGGLTLTSTNGTGGMFVLSGNNTFSGGLTIAGGTTQISNLNGFGTGATTVNSGATLSLGVIGAYSTTGITVNSGATLMVAAPGTVPTIASLSTGANLGFNAAGTVSTGSTYTVSGITSVSGSSGLSSNVNFAAASNISVSSGSLYLNGDLTGGVNLTKVGTGRLFLSGNNSGVNNLNVANGSTAVDGTPTIGEVSVGFNSTQAFAEWYD